jgi:hypothetical protein
MGSEGMSEQPTARLDPADDGPVDGSLGQILGDRYRVLERLGEGGMGVVYVAEHLTLQKKVALKVIHPAWAANPELIARFKREAVATAHLEHAHIVAAFDFGELQDGSAFMVMPWVRGRSLSYELDKQGKLGFRRAARLAAQIADALAAAHAIGIVHRDLKPDNVLLESRSDGESVRVLDFGIASLADGASLPASVAQPLTRVGAVLGTPGYMSPEQATGTAIDHRTDLYALGVMLWEMCQGEPLFPGDDFSQILGRQLREPPPRLELGSSPEERELSELVARLVRLDKTKRPESALEVRDALRRIADSHVALGQSATVAAGSLAELGSVPPRSSVHAAHARAASTVITRAQPRHKLVGAAALAALVVVIAAGGVFGGAQPDENPGSAAAEAAAKENEDDGTQRASLSLKEAEQQLLGARTRDSQRRAAARAVRQEADDAPQYLILAAELELTPRCSEKKEIVLKLREQADPRALPALDRLADTPKRGCGVVRLSDCLGCLRRDLAEAIEALRDGS